MSDVDDIIAFLQRIVGDVIAFESGDMGEEEIIAFFQRIVDNGIVWRLQGSYGRTAKALIEAGYVTPRSA